mmetsp:Transcript_5064/g.7523  ORF Transcript_5064/g.7523 Transcript_5064/m.7523 type:complete len:321 (-) Transcript_5064:1499-2461(-)
MSNDNHTPRKSAKEAMIGWNDLDKNKYFGYSVFSFIGARTLVYPFMLIKTRIQVSNSLKRPTIHGTFKHILKNDGIVGLYRGYWIIAAGVIPSQAAYIGTIELGREYLKPFIDNYEMRSFVSGAGASCASALVGTPIDVVSQRLMVQSDASLTDRKYKNGRDAFFQIYKKNGLRGLYRGFGAGVITYMPTSAIWWGSYSFYQQQLFYPLLESLNLYRADDNSMSKHSIDLAVTTASSVLAATTSVLCTNPLDVVRTRLQVQSHHSVPDAQKRFFNLIQSTIKSEGVWGLWTRGLSARMMSMIPVSTILIITFEITKKLSV